MCQRSIMREVLSASVKITMLICITCRLLFAHEIALEQFKVNPFFVENDEGIRKWGFMDVEGNIILSPQYDRTFDFFLPSKYTIIKKNSMSGVVDCEGRVVLEPFYESVIPWVTDIVLFPIKQDDMYGYMDDERKIVIQPEFDNAGIFSRNGLAAVEKDGKWGYIDRSGTVKIALQYEFCFLFDEGLAIVKKDAFYGVIDESGAQRIPFIYDDLRPGWNGEPYRARRDGKWGYIDHEGNELVPFEFKFLSRFSTNGLASAQRVDGKYGFIDREGCWVINPQFDSADNFSSIGIAAVGILGKYGFINEKGEMVIAPTFDIEPMILYNGVVKTGFKDKDVYLDETGDIYDEYMSFVNGITFKMRGEDGGYFDRNHKMILEVKKIEGQIIVINKMGTLVISEE